MAQGDGIAWLVHTHEHTERSVDWYWTLGGVAVAGAVFSVIFGNILLAAILLIGAGSIGTLAARGPRTHWVRIDSRGISVDGTLYRYDSLNSYWVERGDDANLLIATRSPLHPQIVVPLIEPSRAGAVRSYLKRYLDEEEQHPHLGEQVARLIGL
ncbi:MAG: hypothetical protein AAB964_00820 [Patescibacteria group bacterium]